MAWVLMLCSARAEIKNLSLTIVAEHPTPNRAMNLAVYFFLSRFLIKQGLLVVYVGLFIPSSSITIFVPLNYNRDCLGCLQVHSAAIHRLSPFLVSFFDGFCCSSKIWILFYSRWEDEAIYTTRSQVDFQTTCCLYRHFGSNSDGAACFLI